MAAAVFRCRDINDGVDLADWVEAETVASRRRSGSRSFLRKKVRQLLPPAELDETIDLVMNEIDRRACRLAAKYILMPNTRGLYRSELTTTNLPYLFMLCLATISGLERHVQHATIEIAFDRLVQAASTGLLGRQARSVRFGWPVSGERPPDFEVAMSWLRGKLELGPGCGPHRRVQKDGGVDVVAWRPFADRRRGFIVLLTQCTMTQDWPSKARDIQVDVWRAWIDFGKDPVTCLAIPFVVPARFERWDELSRTVHCILDRERICELIDSLDDSLIADVSRWATAELGLSVPSPQSAKQADQGPVA